MTVLPFRFFCLLLSLAVVHAVNTSENADKVNESVTVVGLGGMGKSVVKCFASQGLSVHAWNRGQAKRQALQEMNLDNVTVHDNMVDAVEKSDIVLMVVGGEGLEPTNDLIRSVPSITWKGKTVVQFANHVPTDAIQQDEILSSIGGKLVAGSIIAVPMTLCSEQATILISAQDQETVNGVEATLANLGRVAAFSGDVGLASLASLAVIQALTFGIAGHELAHLAMDLYNAPTDFAEEYAQLVTTVVPGFVPLLYNVVSSSCMSKKWDASYVPSGVFLRLMEMHAGFLTSLGIKDDTYLHAYIRYLKKIPDSSYGPSAWIEQATVDVHSEL